MNIKINNKKCEIKPASELTVKEYIELFDRFDPKTKNFGILIDYISVTLGLEYKNVADVKMNQRTIRRLFAYIGEIKLAKDMQVSKEFYYKKTGKKYYQSVVNWQSVGVRRMMEERDEKNQLKIAVYLLAILIQDNYDYKKTEAIYEDLQDYNAVDVFSFVIFFFINLYNGKKQDTNFLRRLMRKLIISILI